MKTCEYENKIMQVKCRDKEGAFNTKKDKNYIIKISEKCSEQINLNEYIELDKYLVFVKGKELYRVAKETGEIKIIMPTINNYYISKIAGDKDLVCFIDYNSEKDEEEFVILNVETQKCLKYQLQYRVSKFQVVGERVYFQISGVLSYMDKKIFVLNINTLEVTSVKVNNTPDYLKDVNEICVSQWFIENEKIYFETVSSYLANGQRGNLLGLNPDYIYSYDINSGVLEIVGKKADSSVELGEDITFIDKDILYIITRRIWNSSVEVVSYNLKDNKEVNKIVIDFEEAEFGYVVNKDLKLYISLEIEGFPIYVYDIEKNTKEVFKYNSYCGEENIKKHFFKDASISYDINNPPRIVGNYLFYEVDEEIKMINV